MGGAVFDLKSPKNTMAFLSMHQSDGAKKREKKRRRSLSGNTAPPIEACHRPSLPQIYYAKFRRL